MSQELTAYRTYELADAGNSPVVRFPMTPRLKRARKEWCRSDLPQGHSPIEHAWDVLGRRVRDAYPLHSASQKTNHRTV